MASNKIIVKVEGLDAVKAHIAQLEAENATLKAENERLGLLACDICRGKREYLIDGEPQECICTEHTGCAGCHALKAQLARVKQANSDDGCDCILPGDCEWCNSKQDRIDSIISTRSEAIATMNGDYCKECDEFWYNESQEERTKHGCPECRGNLTPCVDVVLPREGE